MLLDIINTFLILLNWSDDASQYGSQKTKNLTKNHNADFQISATESTLMWHETIRNVLLIITN